MSNILARQSEIQEANNLGISTPTKNENRDRPISSTHTEVDEKCARMAQILMEQRFNKFGNKHRIHWQLFWYATRAKLSVMIHRIVETLIASMALGILLPLLIVTAVAIRLNSPGPIFFKQKRVGKNGMLFDLYKFRSMYIDAEARKLELLSLNEADEIVFKIRQDPRVTSIGRIIRKTSIDELPQILNVLRGEMHLVGPRPSLPAECEHYHFDHLRRMDVAPGITGLQQISGRSDLNFKRWIELDLEYVDDHNLAKDLKILLLTIPVVISGKGAY